MMRDQIQEELAALREIAAKATPGNWCNDKRGLNTQVTLHPCFSIYASAYKKKGGHDSIAYAHTKGDAEYMASAPRQMRLIEAQAALIEAQAAEIVRLKNTNNCKACNGSSWNE